MARKIIAILTFALITLAAMVLATPLPKSELKITHIRNGTDNAADKKIIDKEDSFCCDIYGCEYLCGCRTPCESDGEYCWCYSLARAAKEQSSF